MSSAKIISVFNHKGGVAKTTSAYHIAWMLTDKGKKVLLVDADSQCNLSQIALGKEGLVKFIEENPKDNIKEALRPAFDAQTKPITSPKCPNVKSNEKLFLMVGSMELEKYSVALGFSFLNAFGSTQNLPGSFYALIQKAAIVNNCDYVIIDMNPSLGAINQDLLLSSNYFLIPTAPDFFSLMAIRSLARTIPEWEQWAKNARASFKDAVYPLPSDTPKFLGYTVNDYNIRSGKPTAAAANEIQKINEAVEEVLVPALQDNGLALDLVLYENKDKDKFKMGEIQDFQSTLKSEYQTLGLPVWVIVERKEGKNHHLFKDIAKRVQKSYEGIVDKILHLTDEVTTNN